MNTLKRISELDAKNKASSETELIKRICKQDEAALKALYYKYYSRLYRFISRVNGGISVDEVINDVMYVIWQKAETFNHGCLLSTWIFGIAYNKARQIRRKEGNEEIVFELSAVGDHQDFSVDDKDIKQIERLDLLMDAFKKLSVEQQTVVELTYFHGMSYREISVVMACSENTVKTRMFHARAKLMEFFQTKGETLQSSL